MEKKQRIVRALLKVIQDIAIPAFKNIKPRDLPDIPLRENLDFFHSDPYFLRRDCVNAGYDLPHVRNMQEGVFDPYYGYKTALLRQAFHAR